MCRSGSNNFPMSARGNSCNLDLNIHNKGAYILRVKYSFMSTIYKYISCICFLYLSWFRCSYVLVLRQVNILSVCILNNCLVIGRANTDIT